MNNYRTILGIETSCDETAAAVLQKNGNEIKVLSSIIGSSADLQAKFGGVIPEQAARKQLQAIIPVIQEALQQAFPNNNTPYTKSVSSQASLINHIPPIDAIAVTYGPGLIGSLLVGTETAKTLALAWNKPLLAINHLIGHYYANWIAKTEVPKVSKVPEVSDVRYDVIPAEAGIQERKLASFAYNHTPSFPLIGLLVSGGHTDLVLFKDHNDYQYLGGTRDDAAGECFDKCARLLGYPYPGGPKVSQFAQKGDPNRYKLPIPMNTSGNFDFSFSGLKTAFFNIVKQEFAVTSLDPNNANSRWKRIINSNLEGEDQKIADLCASLEATIVKSLVKKTMQAIQKFNVQTVIVGGGVSANQKLRNELLLNAKSLKLKTTIHFPELKYCGDNAAMIAAAAFFAKPVEDIIELQANPNLNL